MEKKIYCQKICELFSINLELCFGDKYKFKCYAVLFVDLNKDSKLPK